MNDKPEEPAFADQLADDLESIAALARTDDTIARMLAQWPAPILPHHYYERNGAAMAMVLALRALRPLGVRKLSFEERVCDGSKGHRSELWVDIGLRTRRLALYVPLDAVAGYMFNGDTDTEWRYDPDLLAELHRDEHPVRADLTPHGDRWAQIMRDTAGPIHRLALQAGDTASRHGATEWTEDWARLACAEFDKLMDGRGGDLERTAHLVADDGPRTDQIPAVTGGDA